MFLLNILVGFLTVQSFHPVTSVSLHQVSGILDYENVIPRFEIDTTATFPVSVPSNYASTTGYLVVFENRENPESAVIKLPIAIIHSRSASQRTAPVLYLTGGPGSSALNAAAYPGAYPFIEDHDFIVMEQRGTRYAQPSLECPEFDTARQESVFLQQKEEQINLQVEAVTDCKERLNKQEVDLNAYTSSAIAADAEDLRRVLGIDEWILYGISYGSRVALTIMRDFPTNIKAAILVSLLPPQVNYDDESVINFKVSLEKLFKDCHQSQLCSSAFPDLKSRFYDALEYAEVNPLQLLIPVDSRDVALTYDGSRLAGLIDLSTASGIAQTPRLMNQIIKRDSVLLKEMGIAMNQPSRFSWGMRLSVWCSDEFPFSRVSSGLQGRDYLFGMNSAVVYADVCEAWGVESADIIEAEPVFSDIPTLLISGAYDPITPPLWADRAAHTLSNSRHVVFRAAGHTPTHEWDGDGCAMNVAVAFSNNPEQLVGKDEPLPACVYQQQAVKFNTNEP